jgi:nucleoid-associated protein YgaU
MAHEAKLGMAFIGILLTVFGALLIKHLTKHSNLPPMNIAASKTEAGTLTHLPPQPSPPTLVKPLNEDARPPEFTSDTNDTAKQNNNTAWNASKPASEKSDPVANQSSRSTATPPSLLAEPVQVTDVGDRYNKAPVPYRSSYGSTDDNHPTPTVTATPPTPEPAANPFPRVAAVEPPSVNDHTPIAADPPSSYRQMDSSNNFDSPRTSSQSTNTLRQNPSTSSSRTPAVSTTTSDRYAMQPMSRPAVDIATPSSNFNQRTPLASDFTPPATMSGVIPASAPAPLHRNGDQYSVEPNDSFWTISQRAYGTGGYFKALFELNRKRTKDSEDLKVGEILTVPDEAIIRRMYPDLCPKPRRMIASTQQRMVSASNRVPGATRIYTVVDGDTLFEIARHELGKPARWSEIYDLNRDVLGDDFDYLRAGTELILPDAPGHSSNSHSDTATRQPDAVYPR